MPSSLRIVIATTDWGFLRTRNGPQLFSYPVISSQQICAAVISRTGLRTRTMNLRSWMTSSRPHSHMRQSRNKNVGHVDTWFTLLNTITGCLLNDFLGLFIHCRISSDSLSWINQYCALEIKAYKGSVFTMLGGYKA